MNASFNENGNDSFIENKHKKKDKIIEMLKNGKKVDFDLLNESQDSGGVIETASDINAGHNDEYINIFKRRSSF